ncbi:TetR/AcrR family transcriptional regulator [Nocardia sp. NPDC059177]|uniref:TetR/AcrR family transcriptional regulator n=1 Tax=Nocardia sp. NPDC059177 TaxID=3346759 RepID=UPI0036D05E9F
MSTDRRNQLVTGAIDLIATRGIRALTHRALDTALELPPGSTSYYFRTRHALIAAVADGITARSRADFATLHDITQSGESAGQRTVRPDPAEIAHGIAGWLARPLTHRRNELIARHALLIEVLGDTELHARLAGSLFSLDRATELFDTLGATDPAATAGDFLALLEGLVFDRFAGVRAGLPATIEQLSGPVSQFLHNAGRDYSQPNSE